MTLLYCCMRRSVCWTRNMFHRNGVSSRSFSARPFLFQDKSLLTVALLGPPNAGKSTLFNRFLDKQMNKSYRLASDKKPSNRRTGRLKGKPTVGAIVSDVPGTTRDRRECIGRIGGTYFRLVDTAGVDGERLDASQSNKRGQELMKRMMEQTLLAARQADLVFLMFDARVGVTSDLMETVRWLRKVSANPNEEDGHRKIVIVANKLEGDNWNEEGSLVLDHLNEATRVGFGQPIPISAQHGEGMTDLAVIIQELTEEKRQRVGINTDEAGTAREASTGNEQLDRPLQLAILGRQNVGKSTLVNAILKEERVIVGETPGLTRDAIAVEWTWNGRPVQLVDTAGIRKRSRRDHSDEIEDMAVEDAMRAMKVADVAVLVIDADSRMLHRQELAIADAVLKEGRSLVVAANKMDLILEAGYSKEDFEKGVREQLEGRFPMLRKTPIIPMSSLTGESVQDLIPVVFRARERWEQTITTGQLNRWLGDVVLDRPPPRVSGREAKIKYVMQTKGRPPTFLLFCNVDTLPDSYTRYLTRHFQDTFEMYGMEIRMAIKKSATKNPYDSTNKRGGSGLGGKVARMKRTHAALKAVGSAARGRRDRRR